MRILSLRAYEVGMAYRTGPGEHLELPPHGELVREEYVGGIVSEKGVLLPDRQWQEYSDGTVVSRIFEHGTGICYVAVGRKRRWELRGKWS